MTDAEILAAMRAKKAEADRLEAQEIVLHNEQMATREKSHRLWQEITRLHNALLRPDPTL